MYPPPNLFGFEVLLNDINGFMEVTFNISNKLLLFLLEKIKMNSSPVNS